MAQTKRKRRRKHRGTPAGTVEKPGHGSRRQPQSAKKSMPQTAAERRHERLSKPPTWRGVLNRSAIAAIFFAVIALLVLDRTLAQASILALFALLVYIPASYYTDLFMHRRYMSKHGGPKGPKRR